MAFLTTKDGTKIFYNDWGTGTPVVLLHGWPVQSDMWEGQARFLAENGCQVLAYDRRGFGRSSQPWNGYDYDTLTDDLEALLADAGVQGATLVGFSMGGGEVARYFGRHGSSGRATKAVFVSSVTPYLTKGPDNPDGVDPKVFEEIKENLIKDRAHFMKDFMPKFYGGNMLHTPVSDEVIDWSVAMALQGSSRATMACMEAWSGTDFREDLKRITVPTLFIHGTGDKTVPIEVSARRAVKLVPGATLVEYDGEPHGLTATSAERLAKDLLNFIGASGVNAKAPLSAPVLA